MKNKISDNCVQINAEDFFDETGFYLSETLIHENQWVSVVQPDYLGHMQFEWIVEAARYNKAEKLVLLVHMGGKDNKYKIDSCEVEIEALAKIMASYLPYAIVVTDEKSSFIVFESDDNEYWIIAGSKDFMKIAYRASFHAAYVEFSGYWEHEKEIVQKKYENIWNKYAVKPESED